MKRILSRTALATLLAAPWAAHAADLPNRMPVKAPLVAPVPYYNWTGIYFGINGGGGFGSSHQTDPNLRLANARVGISGGEVGGTLGYNYQLGNWVFGLEGDMDWAKIDGGNGAVINGVRYNSYLEWLSTVRGRVGYAFDRLLPYVTGGLAVGDVKATVNPTPTTMLSGTNTDAGWTVGAGLEYGITPNLSVKAEYLYVDLGNSTPVPGDKVDVKTNVVRGGLNWRFNWDGPPHF